ncbi:MAG: MOSC domain-containing protein [Chlorobi bacterium]|nr:MAG: MOSC domain-containing protein [Chlorobi bacterium OLB7]MBK8912449.1 MOSC domain-containing protein [Chlorobiota bacterium]MBX7217635.1 MOSC domain-containing protein [Candidatus Kapabacteria bacterium]
MSNGIIHQINISNGGVPKLPVPEGEVTELGIRGDAHLDMVHHGGPTRALCLYSLEQITALQAEGNPITPGDIGENITTAGIDLSQLSAGDRLQLGEGVMLEITGFAVPCSSIKFAFAGGAIQRVSQKTNPGWSRLYASVLQEGTIRVGDAITRIEK